MQHERGLVILEISPLADTPWTAIQIAEAYAPYLKRLTQKLAQSDRDMPAEQLYLSSLEQVDRAARDPDTSEAEMRRAKARAHWAIAALDLSGGDGLYQTTHRLTEFADHACQSALGATALEMQLDRAGLFCIALGKMGAYELNYSSDIDLAAFVDTDLFDGAAQDPVSVASRLVRESMARLNRQTAQGYVFRTDLRLRPDPGSTPLAVSTRRADVYYESVGQNWERMVWIKARTCAGDTISAQRFLQNMHAFVWRQHLDYWAIADVEAIKNMINSRAGLKDMSNPAPDLKLGPGGIREIEFFVQTQQIILGGRNDILRCRGTLDGLEALVQLGALDPDRSMGFCSAYESLRKVEHRVQMLEDQQTHTIPSDIQKRGAVAALCGYSHLDRFDKDILETRRWVSAEYAKLFAKSGRSAHTAGGNLVFTGVDDDPGTVQTLRDFGFAEPSALIERIRYWHRGHTLATRTRRGRELLTALLPDLLRHMSHMGDPDTAFARFSRFFEGLRSGVQTLSMLLAEPELLEDLIATLALAPSIGDNLARRPSLLEGLLTVSDQAKTFQAPPDADFEQTLDAMRQWHGAESFALGHRLLHGKIAARDAAAIWTGLADTSIRAMAEAARQETLRKFGPAPGIWSIAGLGKLGGQDMTAGSDLDMILVFDPQGQSDAQRWYTRFTQRLIAALSAQTAQGVLYEVDMRLRPSGRAGPVATSLAAFQSYHADAAWTWEHMALTRLRPIAGDRGLGTTLIETAQNTRALRPGAQVTRDILDMRERLLRDKPPSGNWDLKLRRGGLIDIEFIIQHALLQNKDIAHLPHIADALKALHLAGYLCDDAYETVRSAYRFLQSLQQVQRLALGSRIQGDAVTPGLADRFCRATGERDFEVLEARLESHCAKVDALFCEKIGVPATE